MDLSKHQEPHNYGSKCYSLQVGIEQLSHCLLLTTTEIVKFLVFLEFGSDRINVFLSKKTGPYRALSQRLNELGCEPIRRPNSNGPKVPGFLGTRALRLLLHNSKSKDPTRFHIHCRPPALNSSGGFDIR